MFCSLNADATTLSCSVKSANRKCPVVVFILLGHWVPRFILRVVENPPQFDAHRLSDDVGGVLHGRFDRLPKLPYIYPQLSQHPAGLRYRRRPDEPGAVECMEVPGRIATLGDPYV